MTQVWYTRPKIRRRATISAIILLVLVLLLSLLPTYLAHYFLADLLDDFGIEHEGIKTVRVNVWKRQVWVGPVRFRAGESDPGQLGELGIKMSVFPTFQKHAMIERLTVRDISVVLEQQPDNSITINGIPVNQFRPSAAATQPDKKKSTTWGVGLVDFDMQNSRLVLINKKGGSLTVDIESLQLDNFSSWKPDDPGEISLKAIINGFELNIRGNARPFAKHVTFNLDSEVRDFDLEKLAQFSGPIKLDRLDGIYESKLHHEITLFDNGSLEGNSVGNIIVSGVDYARTDQFSIKAGQADIDLDTRYRLSEKKVLQVGGKLSVELAETSGTLPGKNDFSAAKAHIILADLNTKLNADNALYIDAKPKIKVQKPSYSGEVQLSMDAVLNVLVALQSLSANQKEAKQQTGLEKWEGDEVTLPTSDLTAVILEAKFSKFAFNTIAGQVSLDMVSTIQASDIQIATTERSTHINALQNEFKTLQLRSGQGKVALDFDGKTAMTGLAFKGPLGEGKINIIKLAQNLELKVDKGDIDAQSSANANVKDVDIIVLETETLPRAKLGVGQLSADINNSTFSLIKNRLQWQVNGSSLIEKAAIKYTEDENTSAKFDRVEIHNAKVDQDFNINTKALIISGLDGLVTRQLIDGAIRDYSSDDKQQEKNKHSEREAKTDKQQTTRRNIVLGQFVLHKGAHLRFRDKGVTPPVIVDLDIDRAEINNIDTTNPKHQASTQLLAKINEFTNIEVNGQADNLGPNVNLVLKGKLENLELPAYSSYAAEFGGVYLERGRLSTYLDIKAQEGILDGAIKFDISHLKFTPLSEADTQRLSESVGVPIKTAANLLQDKNGNIDLNLPITGSVTDPDVDISSAINKAIGKTLKTIFPPTLIMSILSSANKGQPMTFEPIKFKAGSSELDKAAKKYLDELVTLMKEHPNLSLYVCGRTTPEDFEAVNFTSIKLKPNAKPAVVEQRIRLIETHRSTMLQLAIERTRAVQRHLIKEKGISAKQVGECRALFDPNDIDVPRVVIML